MKKAKTEPHVFRVGMEVVVTSGNFRADERLARVERVTPGGLLAVSGEEKLYAIDAKGDRATERRALPSGRAGRVKRHTDGMNFHNVIQDIREARA